MPVLNNLGQTESDRIFVDEDIVIPFTMDPVEDITGWRISFVLKRDFLTAESVELFEQDATIADGPAGQFSVPLSGDVGDAQTHRDAGAYVYDIRRTDDGSKRSLSFGAFILTQGR
jgi:hypothetical protein